MIETRLATELALLRTAYGQVSYEPTGHWFNIAEYNTPEPWLPKKIPVVFSVTAGYPGAPPYGFFVPSTLRCNGKAPSAASAKLTPPFSGDWIFLSWQADHWKPTADIQSGSNLWGFARGFTFRLAEGP